MANQPILGSVEWMNQSMRTVNPVYDNTTLLTTDVFDGQPLTDDAGNLIVSDEVPPNLGKLLRWV